MDGENWLDGRSTIDAFNDLQREILEFEDVCDEWLALAKLPDDATASFARDLSARLADMARRWNELRLSEVRKVDDRYAGWLTKIVDTKNHLSNLMRDHLNSADWRKPRRIVSNGDARAIVLKKRLVPTLVDFNIAVQRYASARELKELLEKLARSEMRDTKAREVPGFSIEEVEYIG